ncbi:CpsD/CapB family tyrosine-protein kinase [Enterococcus casseliflavus]|uniref:CpsD/CapB family tyrosine-protein kinase n=1 Tax=Enterococcus casseliflavus TaxID=37734 RepID=UPI0039A6995C
MAKKNNNVAPVSLMTVANTNSVISEQLRTIRSNINFSSVDKDLQSMVITSSGAGEGKSTTSANLAVVFANSGKRVLLVDADLRKPTVALTFHLPNHRGLSTLIADRTSQIDQHIQDSGVENLSIMTSGPIPPNPSELLQSQRMTDLISDLIAQFDLIIFDMPPIGVVTDAQILAAKTDGTLLVVRERKTTKQGLIKTKKLLNLANANLIGVVYNGVKKGNNDNYYYYA